MLVWVTYSQGVRAWSVFVRMCHDVEPRVRPHGNTFRQSAGPEYHGQSERLTFGFMAAQQHTLHFCSSSVGPVLECLCMHAPPSSLHAPRFAQQGSCWQQHTDFMSSRNQTPDTIEFSAWLSCFYASEAALYMPRHSSTAVGRVVMASSLMIMVMCHACGIVNTSANVQKPVQLQGWSCMPLV